LEERKTKEEKDVDSIKQAVVDSRYLCSGLGFTCPLCPFSTSQIGLASTYSHHQSQSAFCKDLQVYEDMKIDRKRYEGFIEARVLNQKESGRILPRI